ncbi:MAG: hypothetical protein JW834_00810 [Candidatus Diapherotrites archaeon]|nr:hypothetical protein [Candidatus Diapherotrites archaeon]
MKNYDCIRCKGTRMLCGRSVCPRVEKALQARKVSVAKDMGGSSPSIFVGRTGYPRISVGPMLAQVTDATSFDAPEKWYGTPLQDIVGMRYQLVRTKESMQVKAALQPNRDLLEMQDVAMSERAVDTEVHFSKEPRFSVNASESAAPYGPVGELKGFEVTSNPKIPKKVDCIVGDELKAAEQVKQLYDVAPVSQISKILSVGLLGKDKKLVPTRWSITATDDSIGKNLITDVKEFDEINEYQLFSSEYLGNRFFILLAPVKWCFENLECYVPGNIWLDAGEDVTFMVDWEPYDGRTKYADNVTGAYYCARLGVLEHLKKEKRQAGAIVVREVTPDYWCPVGVWQVRENVRAAMKGGHETFQSLDDALQFMRSQLITREAWEKQSNVLPRWRSRDAFLKWFL